MLQTIELATIECDPFEEFRLRTLFQYPLPNGLSDVVDWKHILMMGLTVPEPDETVEKVSENSAGVLREVF